MSENPLLLLIAALALANEPITEEQGNLIISAINAILLDDDEVLEEELEPLAEEEPEIEEEEEPEEDSSDGNSDDNDDNGDDDGDNEIVPGPIPGPGPINPPTEGDGGEEGSEDEGDESGPELEPVKCNTDERIYSPELEACIPAHGQICPTIVTYGDGPCDEFPAHLDPDLSKD